MRAIFLILFVGIAHLAFASESGAPRADGAKKSAAVVLTRGARSEVHRYWRVRSDPEFAVRVAFSRIPRVLKIARNQPRLAEWRSLLASARRSGGLLTVEYEMLYGEIVSIRAR